MRSVLVWLMVFWVALFLTEITAKADAIPCHPGRAICHRQHRAHPLLESWLRVGQRSREPKRCEHAVVESGHGADPATSEGENVEARSVADAGRGA